MLSMEMCLYPAAYPICLQYGCYTLYIPTKHPALPAEISRHGRHLSTRFNPVLGTQTLRASLVTPEDTVSDRRVALSLERTECRLGHTPAFSGQCASQTPNA